MNKKPSKSKEKIIIHIPFSLLPQTAHFRASSPNIDIETCFHSV